MRFHYQRQALKIADYLSDGADALRDLAENEGWESQQGVFLRKKAEEIQNIQQDVRLAVVKSEGYKRSRYP